MKVLVYGIGVIGSLTVHELCKAGNDVTVVSRGCWKEVLERQGLQIHSGKNKWIDYPKVLSKYDGQVYDVVFSVMQNQQQANILDTLAEIQAKYIVLVGNNLQSTEMQRRLEEKGKHPNDILFAFQASAGLRHENYTEVVSFNQTEFTIGHLKNELCFEEQTFFQKLFCGSNMKLCFMDDMESWLFCHVAFILPAVYLSYGHHCNLRTVTMKDITMYVQATKEAYAFLKSIGMQIRPKNDDKNLVGIRGILLKLILWSIAKTKLGALIASDHCRNAVAEMQHLDDSFNALRNKNPHLEMQNFDELRSKMPTWDSLYQEYKKE